MKTRSRLVIVAIGLWLFATTMGIADCRPFGLTDSEGHGSSVATLIPFEAQGT